MQCVFFVAEIGYNDIKALYKYLKGLWTMLSKKRDIWFSLLFRNRRGYVISSFVNHYGKKVNRPMFIVS